MTASLTYYDAEEDGILVTGLPGDTFFCCASKKFMKRCVHGKGAVEDTQSPVKNRSGIGQPFVEVILWMIP